jgi:TM2 domain-containing membrane protein YozV
MTNPPSGSAPDADRSASESSSDAPQPPSWETPPSQFGPPGYHAPGYPPPPPGAFPPPLDPYPYPPPPPGAYYDPAAPYGRHPITGEPFSEKSKIVAGLLQLVGLLGFVGFGRMYIGQVGFGLAQLAVGLITCGIGAVIWGIVDAVLIFSGSVRDNLNRPLRDGT